MHKKQLFVIETLKGMLQYWKDLTKKTKKHLLTVMKLEILLILWIFYEMRLSTRQEVAKLEVNVCIF